MEPDFEDIQVTSELELMELEETLEQLNQKIDNVKVKRSNESRTVIPDVLSEGLRKASMYSSIETTNILLRM